jgi:RNA polymerase sigma-70 factor (ECF subfamily)
MVTEARGMPLAAIMPSERPNDRFQSLFESHVDFVWRSLRRLGVAVDAVDDSVQEVFVVASRKLDAIDAGKERAFLFGTAVRVASTARRASRRHPAQELDAEPTDTSQPSMDELVDRKRARELLDEIISELPDDTRPVFVLFELEGMTMAEIAGCLELRPGTVASRLRRAREVFAQAVSRHEAARRNHG